MHPLLTIRNGIGNKSFYDLHYKQYPKEPIQGNCFRRNGVFYNKISHFLNIDF